MVVVAQWQSTRLWLEMLRVRIPSATPTKFESGTSNVRGSAFFLCGDNVLNQDLTRFNMTCFNKDPVGVIEEYQMVKPYKKLGEIGRENVRNNFLLTRHLKDYMMLFLSLDHPNENPIYL